jgi:hypothetical protein
MGAMSPSIEAVTEQHSAKSMQLYSVGELFDLPGPEWQIEKVFPMESFVVIYGASGEGKSFLALDMGLSVAQGKGWQGRAVQQGSVVYVAAEGGRSIRKRINAWMLHHNVGDIQNAFFLLEGVQVTNDEDVSSLIKLIHDRGIKPSLIVLDTLARCFVGGDENSAKEMGEFIDGVGKLQKAVGATVMVLHHTGKNGATERGSTALRGAADVMIHVSKLNDAITVENDKQKDDEEFEKITMDLAKVSGSESCVLKPYRQEERKALAVRAELALNVLRQIGPCSWDDWLEGTGLPRTTFHRIYTAMKNDGRVFKVDDKWHVREETPETASGIKASSNSST